MEDCFKLWPFQSVWTLSNVVFVKKKYNHIKKFTYSFFMDKKIYINSYVYVLILFAQELNSSNGQSAKPWKKSTFLDVVYERPLIYLLICFSQFINRKWDSWTTFLLFYIFGMSSKRWRQSCSVPIETRESLLHTPE